MVTRKAATKQMERSDDSILGDIWQALWKEEIIQSIDIHDFSVDVENGEACLSGHVSGDSNQQQIEEIARSVPGVIAVHNHIVADHDLIIQVAQALGKDERTGPFRLPVRCYHGWVEITGVVPSHTLQCAAEEIAASVPAVRGVIRLPDVKGEPASITHDAVQPPIGARVYGMDETEGIVFQVVIQPQNRLVTHAIVRASYIVDGWRRLCDYLVPVEAMQVANEGNILLNRSAPAIHQFPAFNPVDYPFAPLTWQPPYPYTAGNVRWPRQEQAKDRQQIAGDAGNPENK